MQAHVVDVIEECTKASDEERMTFPQVVMKLVEAKVERYHADLVRAEKIYYLPTGESHRVRAAGVESAASPSFSATAVEAAVRAIQARKLTYKQFCEDMAAAGCVGYFVFISGRRAVYYGRTGDNFVEAFPRQA